MKKIFIIFYFVIISIAILAQEQSNVSISTKKQMSKEDSFLAKLEKILSQMTEEQKAYARANWLVTPKAYTNKHNHPLSYIIPQNPTPETQTSFECSACSSAYLLRFYGEETNGVEMYHKPTFPCKHSEGAFPKCFKILFEEQYKNYKTEYYSGTTDDLKNAISQGIPVIVLLMYHNGKSMHYVPVVGYDEKYFYIQDSVEKYRNITNNQFYNEALEISTFDTMWNIPIESCQRLFIIVKKIDTKKIISLYSK